MSVVQMLICKASFLMHIPELSIVLQQHMKDLSLLKYEYAHMQVWSLQILANADSWCPNQKLVW